MDNISNPELINAVKEMTKQYKLTKATKILNILIYSSTGISIAILIIYETVNLSKSALIIFLVLMFINLAVFVLSLTADICIYINAQNAQKMIRKYAESEGEKNSLKDYSWVIGAEYLYSNSSKVQKEFERTRQQRKQLLQKRISINGDPNQSLSMARLLASQGDLEQMLILFIFCFYGISMERDDKASFYWATKLGESNHPQGTYFLAMCYFGGVGTQIDYEKAYIYLKKASDLGSEDAKSELTGMGLKC